MLKSHLKWLFVDVKKRHTFLTKIELLLDGTKFYERIKKLNSKINK